MTRNQPTRPDEDLSLIQDIHSGNMDRFPELVSRYEGQLYRFGLRICRDPRDAEDLVQDTFLNVFRFLKDFRFETRFRNWLYRVAATTCWKKKRKPRFAPETELSLEEFLPQENNDLPADVPQWAAQPIEQVLNQELRRMLENALHELPDLYRWVLVLRDMEGFSTAETSAILNTTSSNVKVRLHRARLYLREKLEQYFSHEN